ncbi:MAG: hypothetical protein C4K48_03290 [Candidatus Thorarchaeota archaeon]|nr:MAG: hypothetical protein C4K48_03290 [Candidatus Thorarchaeota archaeon]
MRRCGLICILLIVVFLIPVTSPFAGSDTNLNRLPELSPLDGGSTVSQSGDLNSGTGASLPVLMNGIVSSVGAGSMQITSASPGTSSVTLTDGWSGTNLAAQIDALSFTTSNVLRNGNLNNYHTERFIVSSTPTYNDDAVYVPDGWTLVKSVASDDPHPLYNVYGIRSDAGGYGGTYGVSLGSQYLASFVHNPNDEVFVSQMVPTPWRQVYSATISFRYYVHSSSTMTDTLHLFTRLGGYVTKYHVFESSDAKTTWLTASVTVQAASLQGLANRVLKLDVGLASDLTGTQTSAATAIAYIDDLQLMFLARPFPEQVDLKANGTIVWGSTSGSDYPYVPDDANRDCWDYSNEIDLDGYNNDGNIEFGIWGSDWTVDADFQIGIQFPVAVPQGAIVTSAWVEVEAIASSSPFMYGARVYVADADNVAAFTAGPPSLENRYSWVPTSIDWTFNSWVTSPDTRYKSPEIGSLVQKVVSRSGWSQGNYICLMIDYMNSDYFQRYSNIKGSTGWGQEDLARLYVEYVIPETEDHVVMYDYQKTITIDHTRVASTLANFPVLIDLVDTDLKNRVLAGGNDIAFTLNGQPLDYEIELFDQNYNATHAHLVAWVKVPSLSSTIDTAITMHYGCEDVPSSYSTGVWDSYEIVQHLNDNPAGIQYDSAANNHHGTSYGSMVSENLVAGMIGNAIEFDGADDAISVGQIYTDQWSQLTMSAWIYHDLTSDDRIFSKAPSTVTADCIMHLAVNSAGRMRVRLSTNTGSTIYPSANNDSISIPTNTAWHYLSWTWSAASQTVLLYIDGVLDRTCLKYGQTVKDSDLMFIIANWETGTSDSRHWDGKIDEIRMLPTLLSGNWILTEWRNQNSPSTFYSVGTESKNPDVWTDAGETSVLFTTDSTAPVTLDVNLTFDIGGNGQTLDEDLDPGTSFFIESGSSIVNWTAKVMVSPPAGATSFGFSVEYPMAEWKPTAVLNPFSNIKSYPQDWWYQAGTLSINSSAIDFWGIWTLKFISWNFAQDLTLGRTGEALSTTATFNIGDSMKYLATTPTVQGATVGLVLTDPSGSVRYSLSNSTITNPSHKFPSFQYRKDFTIVPTNNVYEDVINFPIALDFTDTDLHSTSKVRADGSDIMFAMGSAILPHQIEYFKQDYTVTDARLVVWVCANLSSTVTNTFSMYYGSPIVDNLEDPEGVWGPNMEAVWHLGEDVVDEASTGTHYDATGHGYDGIQHGNVETLTTRVGYAQSFDGNDYISLSESLAPADDVMITGWFRLTSIHSPTSPTTKVIMEKYLDINHDMVIALVGQDYGQSQVPNGSLVFKVESSTNAPMYSWTLGPLGTGTWNAGWYYIGCYSNESDPSKNKIFIGYSQASYDVTVGHYGSTTQANMSYIEEWQLGGGNFETSYEGTGWFTGQMDEFRVATIYRSEGWLKTEWDNQASPTTFASKGTEQARTSPNHTFTQTLLSTAQAGIWTASVYYNDTGASVSTRTGLIERTFTVKRNTYLTLTKPIDAVGDRLSVKTAGDAVIVEFELKDTLNSTQLVNGATVTINWTSPSTVTLDSYGGGKYGKVLDTNDLASAKRWRINVASTHPYYNNANEYFDIDLYHNTGLDSSGVSTTPVGEDFTATLTFIDSYTGTPIQGATITFGDNSPVQSYVDEGSGVYTVTVDSAALSLGDHIYTLKATSSNTYLKTATVTVTFTLRAHYTSVSVQGDFVTPYGSNTQVTVVLIDLDTGLPVAIGSVSTFSFTTDSYAADNFGSLSSFTQILTTNDWLIGTETVTLTVTMSSANSLAPDQFQFDITIRRHRTSLTVAGVVTQPYGNLTPLTVILTDLDNGTPVPVGAVQQMLFQWIGGSQTLSGSYTVSLGTSAWPVGTRIVQVITTMSSNNYDAPPNYQFTITIRKMATVLYYDPASFVFPKGSDFRVGLRLNVSEPGQYYGNPITGRAAGEFSVPSYVFSLDTTQHSIGRYNLTISSSYFPGGTYEIRVYFHSADSRYADASILIRFTYREIVSSLTSPNYPQVTTPFGMNVQITLNYVDEDFGTGIVGATISSDPTWVYGKVDLTGGAYTVWINVTGLAQSTYYINITAYKAGFVARTLQFRIVIRAAYTSVIPSVGSLVIPLGSSVTFYADYTDLDRLLPIDNNTGDTDVVSTWGRFTVEYVVGIQRYRIVFQTIDSDGISSNVIRSFTFSKGANYQTASFNITVTIRTHNTDFRLVSSIEPTSTIGIFNISVYYGDLDNAVGVKSALVIFSVQNASGLVSSSYEYDSVLGDGFYIIRVPASQFGLGLQTFTVYADWTGPYSKFQDKFLVATANVVGRESALTLLLSSEPTPYLGTMSYTFFFSDIFSGIGIDNLTGHVFIFVSFQGESVSPSGITIIDWSASQPGNYSIQFNTSVFSRTGLIYMDISMEWAKGVSPYYANRTDVVSLRVLQRDTLLQTTPPSPTSYGENATFTFTFEDVTGGLSIPINDGPSLTVQLSLADYSVSYNSTSHIFTVSFNTDQFGTTLGSHSFTLGVTWSGVPFYASRTGKLVSVTVIARETFMEFLTPAPTQYMDAVVFNVTWIDITGGASDPISGAALVLYDGLTPINVGKYSYAEIASGIYRVTLNTTYAPSPGTYQLRVGLNAGVSYIAPAYIIREFNIRYRITLLSAEPVATVPYNSPVQVILYYQDLYTAGFIANTSAGSYPVELQFVTGSNWIYSIVWNPVFKHYELSIETYNQGFVIGTPVTVTLRMSYASQAPFYASDDLVVQFTLRLRYSILTQTLEPETTPYDDNAQFRVFFADTDAAGAGIANAQIVVLNNSVPLLLNTHYTLSQGVSGEYIITVDSEFLGGLGTRSLTIKANWIAGSPYHSNATRVVNILVRQRETSVAVTVPPSQVKYLDNVVFTFVYTDLDAGIPITSITTSNIHLRFANGTEITSGFTITPVGSSFEVVISSVTLSKIPVTGLSLIVSVDWLGSLAPFYADATTTLKITIVGRSILVETGQLDRTPKGDTLSIILDLTDLDSGNPVSGAIILFGCQNESFVQGVNYDISEVTGRYTISVYSGSFPGTGVFLFDVQVRWNPLLSPFYGNKTTITLNGLIDIMRASLQAGFPAPPTVQITGSVWLIVTYTDLDHAQLEIGGATISVQYYGSALPVQGWTWNPIAGHPGQYNITFSTSNLPSTGSYTLRISAVKTYYAQSQVTPSFSVTLISTSLTPNESSMQLNWTSSAHVFVFFQSLLTGSGTTGATVTYSVYGLPVTGMTPTGTPGQYQADIDTTLIGAGTRVVTIQASKDQHVTATTTITLVILTLPSGMNIIAPTEEVLVVPRGNSVAVNITLTDIIRAQPIQNDLVIEVYITFRGQQYYLEPINFTSIWTGTIPEGGPTILDPASYDVRITAVITNYNPAVSQFKILIEQTTTKVSPLYPADPLFDPESPRIEAVYSEIITFRLNFTVPAINNTPMTDALVYWTDLRWGLNLNFTHIGGGIWELTFDTTQCAFGTWGITFAGIPDDPIYAAAQVSLTLTIKKITTEVIGPLTTESYAWGWIGNISFFYDDTWFHTGIDNASVTFEYGPFPSLSAYDLGNGTYLLEIDTTYLESDTRYRITVSFAKDNYEERTSGANIFVDLRTTALSVIVGDDRTYQASDDPKFLQVPMNDYVNITFFYNDTSHVGGLFGGINYASIQATLRAQSYFPEVRNITLVRLGNGYYCYIFDTNDLSLYWYNNAVKEIYSDFFYLSIHMSYENRISRDVIIRIEIIPVPTEMVYDGPTEFDAIHGDEIEVYFTLSDTWHNEGVLGANISYPTILSASARATESRSLGNGQYYVKILVVGTSGDSLIRLTLQTEFHVDAELLITVTASPNDTDILIGQVTEIGLPISLVVITLLGLYVKVWSVPKRIRQINKQIKSIRKNKIPKPISDVKERTQLIANLFNDTFAELKITRTAADMPEESIPIQVPEMGELLMQLAILTNLNPDELEEFKADISKMKTSEQAAFVKEVIMQEAMRAARRDGKTIEETLQAIQKQAGKRLSGEEAAEAAAEAAAPVKKAAEEPRLLPPEEEPVEPIVPVKKKAVLRKGAVEEEAEAKFERMSSNEIEELRKDLEKRGVPPYEIDTILEQARQLPRELVEELVKSLEENKK